MNPRFVVIVYNVIGGVPSQSVKKAVMMNDEENARMLGLGYHTAYLQRCEAEGVEPSVEAVTRVTRLSEA